jgi:hypothetical protein
LLGPRRDRRSSPTISGRAGFALLVAIALIAIAAVMATLVTVTLSGNNDRDRIERAADVLHRLVAAMGTLNTNPGQSFGGDISSGGSARYPGRLSQLTHKITVAVDVPCHTATTFGGGDASNWHGPYYYAPIPRTGYNIAPGFFAQDVLVTLNTQDLAIQIPSVSLADAKALEMLVDKRADGGAGATLGTATMHITFPLTDPTTVRYHLVATVTIC